MTIQILHPVILAVPPDEAVLRGREKVAALRAHARRALAQSADLSGVILAELRKDENGAPLPTNGVHWSLSHKDQCVAAVVGPFALGIDIEALQTFHPGLFDKVAQESEWHLAPDRNNSVFLRYWTAKEAVLKAVGKGLTGLSRCRIVAIEDEIYMVVDFENHYWRVTHRWVDERHLVALTAGGLDIVWHAMDGGA